MEAAVDARSGTAGLAAAAALQRLLPQLIALSLSAKQAHWSVTGRSFLAVHALTDQIAENTRQWADRVAERTLALGYAVDGRAGTVAAVAGSFPAGAVSDAEAIVDLGALIEGVVDTARSALVRLECTDAVAHDITVAIIEGLDKYRWMLCAQAH